MALAFEQLKERLKAKGYFDAEKKKSMPKNIKKIALVTAQKSAALHDMLKIIEKRWALVEVLIIDTLVQGAAAAEQIVRSLRYADTLEVDVIIVSRGGGSVEDLWAFNEEIVANAIFALRTPVVSAVGHEIDVLISDFVADLRAPTPSAAIEMILPDEKEILYTLDELMQRYSYAIKHNLQRKEQSLEHSEEMLLRSSPLQRLIESQRVFSRLEVDFQRVMYFILQQKIQEIEHFNKKIKMYDPTLLCKKGWAQISVKGQSTTLSELQENESFTLEDASVKMEAVCIHKKIY